MNDEVWREVKYKDIKTGSYLVSNMGNVYGNQRRKNLTICPNHDGYGHISIMTNNNTTRSCLVHRIVANEFLENPNNYTEINHINSIKSDNRVSNLEWCTRSHNIRRCFDEGLKNNCGENSPTCKLTDKEVEIIFDLIKVGKKTNKDIAKFFGLKRLNIWNLEKRKKTIPFVIIPENVKFSREALGEGKEPPK